MEVKKGRFQLDSETVIVASGEALETADYLQDFLKQHTGFDLPVVDRGHDHAITLSLDGEQPNPEGYHFESDKEGVLISASSTAGLFYGVQTLRQLLPVEVESPEPVKNIRWALPSVVIDDQPSLAWRGFMLDCSRHFFPPEFIKKILDNLAARKMNTFHWHLTDHQGWRMEVKKYPKLTEVAAWRVAREGGWADRQPQQPGEVPDYGGFYTQEQIRDIVEYARKRNITIVPEIEMPSHTTAVFAAYPRFSCSGKKITVPPGSVRLLDLFSTMPELKVPPEIQMADLFCAGNDSTFAFLEDVLTEVMELFPSEYIHIGCDEVNTRAWGICPKCQARTREEKLPDADALQGYFIKRIQEFIQQKGRKSIIWYKKEILDTGLDTASGGMMVWRRKQLHDYTAVKKGFPVVMAPSSHCYFDAYQGPFHMELPTIGNYISLGKVYTFDPVSPDLNQEEAGHIMGGQGCLWTETVPTTGIAESKIFPRLEALSEVLWTPKSLRDSMDFKRRMVKQVERYESAGIHYSPGAFYVLPDASYHDENGTMKVQLTVELPMGDIYYTMDGSDPGVDGILYRAPFEIKQDCLIKAVQVRYHKPLTSATSTGVCINKAKGTHVTYGQPVDFPYIGRRDNTQTINGIMASADLRDWEWIGFRKESMIRFTIDLGQPEEINTLKIGFLNMPEKSVLLPESVAYFLSDDGENYTKVQEVPKPSPVSNKTAVYRFPADIGKEARYVKVVAKRNSNKATWMLTDEIIVN